jgi:hypothetical protein
MVVGVAAVPLGFLLAIGMEMDAPMLQQPWGWWILVPVLVSLVLGTAIGWLLGVMMTIVLARLLGWTWQEGLQVFWFKIVPERWRLSEWRGDESFGLREAQRKWDEERSRGPWPATLRFALTMLPVMFFSGIVLPQMENPSPLKWQGIAYPLLIWLVTSALFGWFNWRYDRRPE